MSCTCVSVSMCAHGLVHPCVCAGNQRGWPECVEARRALPKVELSVCVLGHWGWGGGLKAGAGVSQAAAVGQPRQILSDMI